MKTSRPPTSPHGKLFGGDSLYEVLATLAGHRDKRFTVLPIEGEDQEIVPLAQTIGRTVTQTRREVRKLQTVGVLEEVDRQRKTEVYAVRKSKLADRVLSLPDLLMKQLGPYGRPPKSS